MASTYSEGSITLPSSGTDHSLAMSSQNWGEAGRVESRQKSRRKDKTNCKAKMSTSFPALTVCWRSTQKERGTLDPVEGRYMSLQELGR